MNDKTEQALTDALIDQIESAARASFRRHQSSIKGQILTATDNYDWHLLHAAYQAGIHTLRAKLAEAQGDADRYRAIKDERVYIECPNDTDPKWYVYGATAQGSYVTGADLDAAIDAAKGEPS